jgi:hypothetical protein
MIRGGVFCTLDPIAFGIFLSLASVWVVSAAFAHSGVLVFDIGKYFQLESTCIQLLLLLLVLRSMHD